MLKKMTTLKNFSEVSLEELVKVNGGCGVKEGLSPACKQQGPKNKNKGGAGGGGGIPIPENPQNPNQGYQDYLNVELDKRAPGNRT